MIFVTCAAVRRRLPAFHDGELSVADQIAVESHLEDCARCAFETRDLRMIGDALRQAATRSHQSMEATAGLQEGVLSRMQAERDESLPVRLHRMFEDMHLVWAGVGAAVAGIACIITMSGLLHFSSAERADSLAGILAAMASPDAEQRPVPVDREIRLPRVYEDAVMPALLVNPVPNEADALFALTAVVTREGRLTDLELLLANRHDRAVLNDLLDAASAARFEPARLAGSPVPYNMVWLLTHTTVRGKLHAQIRG